jgi:hypothetical protein
LKRTKKMVFFWRLVGNVVKLKRTIFCFLFYSINFYEMTHQI